MVGVAAAEKERSARESRAGQRQEAVAAQSRTDPEGRVVVDVTVDRDEEEVVAGTTVMGGRQRPTRGTRQPVYCATVVRGAGSAEAAGGVRTPVRQVGAEAVVGGTVEPTQLSQVVAEPDGSEQMIDESARDYKNRRRRMQRAANRERVASERLTASPTPGSDDDAEAHPTVATSAGRPRRRETSDSSTDGITGSAGAASRLATAFAEGSITGAERAYLVKRRRDALINTAAVLDDDEKQYIAERARQVANRLRYGRERVQEEKQWEAEHAAAVVAARSAVTVPVARLVAAAGASTTARPALEAGADSAVTARTAGSSGPLEVNVVSSESSEAEDEDDGEYEEDEQ